MFAYLVSLGAVAGGVVMLLQEKQAQHDLWLPSASVAQSCLVLLSGMVYWLLVPSHDGNMYSML